MSKAYFLMKAQKARPDLVHPGMQWSIKLDGMRAWWDGGVSRGRTDAPWAPGLLSTGLWSNFCKVIHAPDWWLDNLPNYMCDGELWAGPGMFQYVMSVCKKKVPDNRWNDIKFVHHTCVGVDSFLTSRLVNERGCRTILSPGMADYFLTPTRQPADPGPIYSYLQWHDVPYENTWEELNLILDDLVAARHEGIMIREPNALWTPERTWNLLKLKPFNDVDVTVVGVQSGRETDKGSRLLGKVGSLVCRYRGQTFNVSGFQDHERELVSLCESKDGTEYACDNPGVLMPAWIQSKSFPNGSKITVKYRELTDRGVPKDPRYWRKTNG